MIGIIAAMKIEMENLVADMTDVRTENIGSVVYHCGKLNGTACVIAMCGVGKVNAAVCTQTMILTYHPDYIINTGIGGSTSRTTHIGHTVIADRVVQHDMDTTALGDELGLLTLSCGNRVYIDTDLTLRQQLAAVCDKLEDITYTFGTVATGDQFICGNEKRTALNEKFGAIVCEMEGGAIGQTCFLNGVPFAILRSISDSMNEEDDAMEYSRFSQIAAKKSCNIIKAFTASLIKN